MGIEAICILSMRGNRESAQTTKVKSVVLYIMLTVISAPVAALDHVLLHSCTLLAHIHC